MNAQEKWKLTWKEYLQLPYKCHTPREVKAVEDAADKMFHFRREAALERHIARLERESKRLQELLDMANYAVWHEQL